MKVLSFEFRVLSWLPESVPIPISRQLRIIHTFFVAVFEERRRFATPHAIENVGLQNPTAHDFSVAPKVWVNLTCRQAGILICVLSCLVGIFSCKKNEIGTLITPAFYHWQTQLQLTDNERLYLDSIGVKKLYVKFFDVDWDEASQQPVPLAEVEIDTTNLSGLEIVPTVFITNRTLVNLPEAKVEELAERVREKIVRQSSSLSPQSQVREIQMDCDWTASTKEKYFQFLKYLQEVHSPFSVLHSPLKLSATIRLHQFKYPKRTGVPPVDRGMLMVYNVGEVDEWETENSILDLEILDQYLGQSSVSSRQYVVPLDLALPLFRWGAVFRDGELVYLVNDLGKEHLQDTVRFANTAANRYEVRKSTYLQGYYLYEGDKVRLEGIDQELLERAVERFADFSKNFKSETVAFYHLDTTTLKVFDHEKIRKILEPPPATPRGGE